MVPVRLRSLRLRGQFLALLATQLLLLALVAALGGYSLLRLRGDQAVLGASLPKASAVARVLHDSDVLRVVHVSLLGAGRNPDYVDKRVKRLAEVEADLTRSLADLEAQPWNPAERAEVDRIGAGLRQYQAAFPPLLARARTANPADLPALIEANTAYRREGYNLLLAMLPRLQGEGQALVAQDLAGSRAGLLLLLAGFTLALVLGLGFTRILGTAVRRQATDLQTAMAALQRGDLAQRCAAQGGGELGEAAASLNGVLADLGGSIRTITEASQRVASSATELSATVAQVKAATEEISESAQTQRTLMEDGRGLAAGMGQLATEVRAETSRLADLAAASEAAAQEARGHAEASDQAMAGIQEGSRDVGRIAAVIADLARQTNLLSLNAAIEAAKAGAMGKGFAVVAEEVRKLAERSSSAAKEIAALVGDSAARVDLGLEAVARVNRGLETIQAQVHQNAEAVRAIAGAMERQAGAATQMLDRLQAIGSLTDRHGSATTELAATLVEIARTVDDLAALAVDLQSLTGRFRLA